MPSPIAHAAVVLLVPPLTRAAGRTQLRGPRWVLFHALVILVLCLPDIDFALPLLVPLTKQQAHGAWTHSLLAGLVGGVLFAMLARLALGSTWRFRTLALIGVVCYWTHLLMDLVTNGRGIMLLWPLTSARIRSPYPLFTGIHWSDPSRWDLHLRTAMNEGVFVLLVAGVAAALMLRIRRAGETGA